MRSYIKLILKNKSLKYFVSIIKIISPMFYVKLWRFINNYNAELKEVVLKNVKLINKDCRPVYQSKLFIDCGVNEGFVLSLYKAHLPDFQYVGFEIQEEMVEFARKRNPGVNIIHSAVSTVSGELNIFLPKYYGPNFKGGSTTVASKFTSLQNIETRTCQSIDFIEYLFNQRNVHGVDYIVVKMDIEGAEFEIIEALFRHYERHSQKLIDLLIVEFHSEIESAVSEAECISYLEKMGTLISRWV